MSKYIIEWFVTCIIVLFIFMLISGEVDNKDMYLITCVWAVARISKSIEDRR
jgi:hypothetical protein